MRAYRDHTDFFSDDLKHNKYKKRFYRITGELQLF